MKRVKLLTCSVLAVLAAMLLTGCQWNDNPVRTSLEVEQTDLTLQVGESATRAASTQSKDYEFIYTSSNPAVATVDQNGKVTALTVGETTITVTMPETKVGWYAAATREYKVFVKKVSAAALADVDKTTPLTLVAAENGKITVTFNNGVTLKNDIKYTINGGAEQTIAKNTSGAYDITVKKGDVVQLYSLNSSLGGSAVAGARGGTRAVDSGAKYINIRPSMKTEIYGNVMSLLKGKDNLEGATAIEAPNAFYGLFAGAENLVNSADRLLVLPATTLKEGCYDNMFSGCKGIEKAPVLPAPKLEKGCYQEMFFDCSKLNSVKCLASDVAASDALKDFLKGAGTAAEKTPVIETATPLPAGTVPSNFTEAKAVTGIKLSETTLEMTVSDTKPLTATLTPAEATNKTLEWTSSNPAVATVLGDATDNTKATVTAVGAGSATITCSTPDGSVKATCAVTVAAPQQEEDVNLVVSTNGNVTWTEGSYIVEGSDVIIDGTVTIDGSVNLTLKAGAKLTVKNGIKDLNYGSGTINIYGEGEGSNLGHLIVESLGDNDDSDGTPIIIGGMYIFGGFIESIATNGGFGYGIETSSGSISMYGGKVVAAGNGSAGIESAGAVMIFNGLLTATGGSYGSGISAQGSIGFYGGSTTAVSGSEGGSSVSAVSVFISSTAASLNLTYPAAAGDKLTDFIQVSVSDESSSLYIDDINIKDDWNGVDASSDFNTYITNNPAWSWNSTAKTLTFTPTPSE